MFRALVALGAIVALIMAAKDGVVLKDLGLVGSCRPVAAPAGMTVEWRACNPGKLDGHPDLTKELCISRGKVGRVEYWVCPFQHEHVSSI